MQKLYTAVLPRYFHQRPEWQHWLLQEAAVRSPKHHPTSKLRRKSAIAFSATTATLSKRFSQMYNVQCYKYMQSFLKWCGVDCLEIYVFQHGPVNIYGARESNEGCNNTPWAARCDRPFWCTTALQKQTHKLNLSLSHKQIVPQSSQQQHRRQSLLAC